MSGNVKVVSRFRPPNALELREGGDIVVDFDEGENTTVKLKHGPASGPEAGGFTFDRVFPMGTRQKDVFEFGIKETVDDVLNGYNGTIFAYGQTGSGKTFTMMGSDIDDENLKGIIPRITEQIFDNIMASPPHLEYLVKVSYLEIYMERIRDLLAPQNDNLQIHEEKNKGVYVKGLSDFYVGGQADVYEIMRQGGLARAVSSTNMNAESSRSHSIFLVTIQQRNTETGSQKTGNLYLVDLAGSEKVGKTGASGQTLEEAKKINKSLSALGMVINALTDGKSSHIPYRDSKLTRILQESLGGNSRTTLIINCSPCAFNQDETISTLRFGVRAKSIKNKARVNAELSPAELKALLKKAQVDAARYQNYIAALEGELKQWRAGGTVPESDWAEVGKVAAGAEGLAAPAAARSATASPSVRPQTPAIEALLREGSSRPDTPTSSTLDKDERDEFLRRENELQDTIAKLENELEDVKAAERIARDELSSAREQEQSGKEMSQRLEECKLELDSVRHKLKEAEILNDVHADSIRELTVDVDELRKAASESTRNAAGAAGARDPGHEGKERKKAERMAKMMADFNAGIVSEKEEQIRETLAKLEIASGMGTGADGTLSADDISTLREQLLESQTLVREQHERVRQVQDENELLLQRRDEMEARLATLEAEYEELLDKTYHDGQDAGTAGINDAMLELRGKLEDQYASRREAQASEIADLKKQLELKAQERASMQAANDALRSTNDELKRAFAVTAAAAEGGKDLAESAREMERVRKTMATQLSEFDNMKKSLMRDLQNRCEKVVELEISLDESKEQYNNVIRSSNSKAQQKKMHFLERNLEQLTSVQKQLVDQNGQLKKEVAIAERKLVARNERIESLESHLLDSQEKLALQNRKFDEQLQAVKERLSQAREMKGAAGAGAAALGFGRIAKPLRGGGPTQGGAQGGPGAPQAMRQYPGVASAQNMDSSSPKARSSWFFSAAK
ncbi:putative kinesin-1 motor protein [Tilletiopsis washingtonensis]|uniref:Putative kinesin-1 motor protein n=1 Tax=Tilletiopsis washingtonensis TaxID=58919 RepID=A0A316ZDQ4_9BASI|nr:putative kinesin-1 motor protein [Tilletiopsis washingtonensis]PWN99042.1 putative kinesin-1 motor protein [Tilletiopsis washingtonensis]